MVAVLTKSFGIEHIEIAEDIVSETFLTAMENWPYKGIPANPTAWLYKVAQNKLKNYLTRSNHFNKLVSQKLLEGNSGNESSIDFSAGNISDSQLQMLFAVCHPSISVESQISLALRILGGLGLSEIADAFFTSKEVIHKRLQRAKEKLNENKVQLEMPAEPEIPKRLESVLRTIYLLFSEGYYSESNPSIIRKELCVEALNLTYLLLENPQTNLHSSNALMSLLCFQASRLEARQTVTGNTVLYDEQDRSLWDRELIEKGFYYLQQASQWQPTSTYYIEASIAYWHTVDHTFTDKWESILKLYDALLILNPSPMVALNRIWALSKVKGVEAAIKEAEQLSLTFNRTYYILMGELYREVKPEKSQEYLETALSMSKSTQQRAEIQLKMQR